MAWLQPVFDALHDGIVIYDGEGRVTSVNRRAEEIFGYTEAQLAGRVSSELSVRLFQSDGAPLVTAEMPSVRAARAGQPVAPMHLTLLRADGERRRLLVSSAPEQGPDGRVTRVVTTVHDLTDEDRRHDLEEFRRFFDEASELLVVFSPDFHPLEVNDAVRQVLGFTREEVLGPAGGTLFHADDRERLRGHATRQPRLDRLLVRLRCASGAFRAFHLSARRVASPRHGDCWYGRAVPSETGDESSVAAQTLALEIAQVGTWERDWGGDGTRLRFSREARALFGVPEAVAIDSLWGFLTPETLPVMEQAVKAVQQGQSRIVEGAMLRPDGQTRRMRSWLRPRFDGGGAVVGLIGVIQDVTEAQRMEEQLHVAERMAAVGTLAAGMAHEINNPLAFVTANIQSVRRELAPLDTVPGVDLVDVRDALSEAAEGADRVRQIVADLKTFSRSSEGTTRLIDVNRVVLSALNLARNETRHRAAVITRLGDLPMVRANESRLGSVVLNLVVNAAQSIPDGRAAQNTITVSTWARHGLVFISVRDTGVGISAEHRSRIFDPFFSTRAVGGGTGLGLYITQGIVRELGGEIRLDSTPGKGTTFEVQLPAATEATADEDDLGLSPSPQTGARVLVIDDEPLVLRAVQRLLGPRHHLTLARSADEAQAVLTQGFDLILCDVMMPERSGPELYSALPLELQRRVVFVTGGTFSEETRRFLDANPVPVLDKPFTLASLQEALRAALGRR
jgi:PAS domain S-box-containing protein